MSFCEGGEGGVGDEEWQMSMIISTFGLNCGYLCQNIVYYLRANSNIPVMKIYQSEDQRLTHQPELLVRERGGGDTSSPKSA